MASFQDLTHLYLVMEYMPGGDFLGLLMREDVLHESIAQIYIAEMISAVEETHRLKFIHRDLKPDNFLISPSGHLKISDFGLAFDGHWSHDAGYYKWHRHSSFQRCRLAAKEDVDKTCKKAAHDTNKEEVYADYTDLSHLDPTGNARRRATAYSVVGTSQYMAPEVVAGRGYDGRCD